MKQNTISFLSEILSAEGIRLSDDRISVINNMMKSQNREEVQRLLGLVNYVGKYIPNLSNRTKYIRTLLCKNTDWNWSHERENEWQDLTKKNREEMQRLLGLVNYVGKYIIINLSNGTNYIRTLLCKNSDWNWSHEHENEWQDLKKVLTHKPVLAYYDVTLKIKVSTDVCIYSLGAFLLQMHGNDWKPVAYAARSMASDEKNI